MDASPSDFRFGCFRLDAARRVLLVDGKPARLGARAVDVLIALVERRDRIVGKNELFDLVWPGLVVEENNLQVHVSALRKLLGAQAIATIPGRGYQFVADLDDDAAAGDTAAPIAAHVPVHASPASPRTNLAEQAPPLYGRERDVTALHALLRRHPIVTIAGAAGIGKTALARAIAHQSRDTFADGVWLVELAATHDAAHVVAQVARAVGTVLDSAENPLQTLAASLRTQAVLVVLDNCEHVLDATAALVAALRRGAPRVKVLATSQENLKVEGEQVYRLAPLAAGGADLDGASSAGAVQLFVARAQATDHGFALTPANVAAVVEICQRLDGLPLAIELAAARLRLLGVEGIRARLSERFRVLTGGARFAPARHQTLHAAFAWSHDLLSLPEQVVFRRLGVFVGGFSLEYAQRVAGDAHVDTWSVLDQLGQLVDKSLVFVEGHDVPRYRLLETGRAFALDRLEQAGETDALLRQHAQAMCDLLREFDAAVVTEADFAALVARVAPEHDNLQAALHWATGARGDRPLAIALVASCDWLWHELDQWREGWRWCQLVLPWIGPDTPRQVAARFYLTSAGLGSASMLPAREWIGFARTAALAFRALGDAVGLYRALCVLGGQSDGAVPRDEAIACLDEAGRIEDAAWSPRIRLRRQASLEWRLDLDGDLHGSREAGRRHVALARACSGVAEVAALSNLADTEFALGNRDAAIAMCRESIARGTALGRPAGTYHAYCNMVPALLERGDLDDAAAAIAAGHASFMRGLGTAFVMLVYVAALAQRRGDSRLAARVLACTDRVYVESGRAMHPPERRARDKLAADLAAALPAPELDALSREGSAWTEDEAFARGLA